MFVNPFCVASDRVFASIGLRVVLCRITTMVISAIAARAVVSDTSPMSVLSTTIWSYLSLISLKSTVLFSLKQPVRKDWEVWGRR